jgi:hypothetical protein
MGGDVAPDRMAGHERAGEHQADRPLLKHVGGAVPAPRLEPRVGDLAEAQRLAVEGSRLRGVADVKLHVIDSLQGHAVVDH